MGSQVSAPLPTLIQKEASYVVEGEELWSAKYHDKDCSVFICTDSPALQGHIRRLKQLRHNRILAFHASLVVQGRVWVITEHVVPLSQGDIVSSSSSDHLSLWWAWHALEALDFMHRTCDLAHTALQQMGAVMVRPMSRSLCLSRLHHCVSSSSLKMRDDMKHLASVFQLQWLGQVQSPREALQKKEHWQVAQPLLKTLLFLETGYRETSTHALRQWMKGESSSLSSSPPPSPPPLKKGGPLPMSSSPRALGAATSAATSGGGSLANSFSGACVPSVASGSARVRQVIMMLLLKEELFVDEACDPMWDRLLQANDDGRAYWSMVKPHVIASRNRGIRAALLPRLQAVCRVDRACVWPFIEECLSDSDTALCSRAVHALPSLPQDLKDDAYVALMRMAVDPDPRFRRLAQSVSMARTKDATDSNEKDAKASSASSSSSKTAAASPSAKADDEWTCRIRGIALFDSDDQTTLKALHQLTHELPYLHVPSLSCCIMPALCRLLCHQDEDIRLTAHDVLLAAADVISRTEFDSKAPLGSILIARSAAMALPDADAFHRHSRFAGAVITLEERVARPRALNLAPVRKFTGPPPMLAPSPIHSAAAGKDGSARPIVANIVPLPTSGRDGSSSPRPPVTTINVAYDDDDEEEEEAFARRSPRGPSSPRPAQMRRSQTLPPGASPPPSSLRPPSSPTADAPSLRLSPRPPPNLDSSSLSNPPSPRPPADSSASSSPRDRSASAPSSPRRLPPTSPKKSSGPSPRNARAPLGGLRAAVSELRRSVAKDKGSDDEDEESESEELRKSSSSTKSLSSSSITTSSNKLGSAEKKSAPPKEPREKDVVPSPRTEKTTEPEDWR